ncbi:MAG: flagellar motor switch protein FliM [Limnochordales bacterium]|nr:flagellar motor switch protein FliM [Limnochordales bacterium]
MDEVLSQPEIDRLIAEWQKARAGAARSGLAGLAARGQPGKLQDLVDPAEPGAPAGRGTVQKYDFRRPYQLTRDQVRLLRRVCEDFTRNWSSMLSARLRLDISLNLSTIQLISYYEYLRLLPNPTVITTLQINATGPAGKVSTSCFCQIGVGMALVSFARLCGGRPQASTSSRELTELERRVLQQQLFGPLTEALRDAWRGMAVLEVRVSSLETNPYFLSTGAEQDMLAVATFEGVLGPHRDFFSLAIPYPALVTLAPDASRELNRRQAASEAERARLRAHLGRLPVRVDVYLGRTTLTVGELLSLQPGDLLLLPVEEGSDVQIAVGQETLFWARLGRKGRRVAVQILRPVASQ